jgi:hypothetical protein
MIDNGCHPLTARLLYRKELKNDLCFTHTIEEEKNLEILLYS